MDANTRKITTQKNPALIRKSGSSERRRARRYAADPMAVVLTYIWAWDDSASTGDEVRTCEVESREESRTGSARSLC